MNKYQLKSIHIEGYKSIKYQTIPLSNMNVLIGQNGAGKSNFISAFKFLRNIIEGRLKLTTLKIGAENLLYYGSKETNELRIYLNFDPDHYEIRLQPTINDSLIIFYENCGITWRDDGVKWKVVTIGEPESKLSASPNKQCKETTKTIRSWRVYHFHDTGETSGIKKYGSVSDYEFLFEDASNLAAYLFVMKHSEKEFYERITKTVRLVIPFFNDFHLGPNPLNKEKIRLEWTDIHSDKIFTGHDLSDGSLRFICLATLLLQKELPDVILLDEPELGLHPSAITILSGLLRKASTKSQVIVSTQSVSLVNEFDAEDIIVVENKTGETTFNRLYPENLEGWLDDYSMGELWDKNIFGGKP